MRTALGLVAIVLGLGSAIFVFAALGDIVQGGDGKTPMGVLWGLLVFFLGVTLTCAWFARRMLLGGGRRTGDLDVIPEPEREQIVLTLAKHGGGRVTVTEIAAESRLTIAEAEETLERMCQQGVAVRMYTEGHGEVFAFQGLMSTEDKARARDPLA